MYRIKIKYMKTQTLCSVFNFIKLYKVYNFLHKGRVIIIVNKIYSKVSPDDVYEPMYHVH